MDREFASRVLAVAKRLDEKNLVNAYEGNISAKKDGIVYITPTGKNKALLTEDMIAVIDADGKQIGGRCKPTSELPMHLQTYQIREDIGGVVHCHPTYLTAHAICNKPVESKGYPEMMANFKVFEVAPYGRPGTEEILKGAVPIFRHSDVVLLGNHGVLAVGATVEDAMNKVEAAESITKALYYARALGEPLDLSEEECRHFYKIYDSKYEK